MSEPPIDDTSDTMASRRMGVGMSRDHSFTLRGSSRAGSQILAPGPGREGQAFVE